MNTFLSQDYQYMALQYHLSPTLIETAYKRGLEEVREKGWTGDYLKSWMKDWMEGYIKGYIEGFTIGYKEGCMKCLRKCVLAMRAKGFSNNDIAYILKEDINVITSI